MDVLNLWLKATGNFVCKEYDCDGCRNLYGMKRCALDAHANKSAVSKFISRVTTLICDRKTEECFDWEMSDEEFVQILEQAAHSLE